MKKMRKLVWMLLAATMVGFAACSSDDDEDWVETPGGGGGGTTGTVDVCGDATPVSEYTFDFQTGVVDNENFNVQGWKNVIVSGTRQFQGKEFDGNFYIQATAHNATSDVDCWVISPALNVSEAANKVVSFDLAQAYWKESTEFGVYVLQCDNGTTKETKLTGFNMPTASTTNYSFISSGNIDLSAYSGTIFIGFHYKGTGGSQQSTTWCIDNFVFGKDVTTVTTVSITSAAVTTVTLGSEYNYTVKTTVNNPSGNTEISATGLPSWLTIQDNGDGTAVISGTAPSAEETTGDITITAKNNNVSDTQTFKIEVKAPVQPGENLLLNGDFATFTDGGFPNWTKGNNASTVWAQSTTTVHAPSTTSLSLTNVTGTTYITQTLKTGITAGKQYDITVWYYNVTGGKNDSGLRLWSFFLDANITYVYLPEAGKDDAANDPLRTNNKYFPNSIGEWSSYTTTVTAPENAVGFKFEIRAYRNCGDFFIGECSIAEKQ